MVSAASKRLNKASISRKRLGAEALSGRTVTVKVRLPDFSTHTRSATLPGPTDDPRVVARLARRLLGDVETVAGVRLLGVGVSGLADWVQEDLFTSAEPVAGPTADPEPLVHAARRWVPGMDVVHAGHGPGWVWGSGRGLVTVRFETRDSGPGPVRTLPDDDPALSPAPPPTLPEAFESLSEPNPSGSGGEGRAAQAAPAQAAPSTPVSAARLPGPGHSRRDRQQPASHSGLGSSRW